MRKEAVDFYLETLARDIYCTETGKYLLPCQYLKSGECVNIKRRELFGADSGTEDFRKECPEFAQAVKIYLAIKNSKLYNLLNEG